MSENSLIERCQRGKADAFEQLLALHYDTIYRFAYRWCGDQHNTQDITQLACITLARSTNQF
ncbi:MAG: RNA polymerase sigma-70 factor (ECF subfamily) [Arenicella sp.]|jgi:RNA polymerase sigma-70 factor (ECF subfamily)